MCYQKARSVRPISRLRPRRLPMKWARCASTRLSREPAELPACLRRSVCTQRAARRHVPRRLGLPTAHHVIACDALSLPAANSAPVVRDPVVDRRRIACSTSCLGATWQSSAAPAGSRWDRWKASSRHHSRTLHRGSTIHLLGPASVRRGSADLAPGEGRGRTRGPRDGRRRRGANSLVGPSPRVVAVRIARSHNCVIMRTSRGSHSRHCLNVSPW